MSVRLTCDKDGPSLTPGQKVPDLSLISSSGQSERFSDFRGRRNVVVVLLYTGEGASSRRLLTDLAERYAEFTEEDTEILSVIRGPVDGAPWIRQWDNLPFPVLSDENGRVHRALGGHAADAVGGAVVYVADRCGEVFYAQQAPEGQSLPTPEEILGWVRFIELQCPQWGGVHVAGVVDTGDGERPPGACRAATAGRPLGRFPGHGPHHRRGASQG